MDQNLTIFSSTDNQHFLCLFKALLLLFCAQVLLMYVSHIVICVIFPFFIPVDTSKIHCVVIRTSYSAAASVDIPGHACSMFQQPLSRGPVNMSGNLQCDQFTKLSFQFPFSQAHSSEVELGCG